MSGTNPRGFTVVDEPPAQESAAQAAGRRMLLLGIQALSARVVIAISNLFTLILVGVMAALLWRVLDAPTPNQMYCLTGFAVFCVAIEIVRRKAP